MSDVKRTPVYLAKCSAKQQQNGASKRVRISVNKDEIAKYADAKGYVALNITERKEASQYWDTHNITIVQRTAQWEAVEDDKWIEVE